jgi:hypothetical protein
MGSVGVRVELLVPLKAPTPGKGIKGFNRYIYPGIVALADEAGIRNSGFPVEQASGGGKGSEKNTR